MSGASVPKILLLWPGSLPGGGANFGVPQVVAGDTVVELGGGTGYGSAIARQLVGPTGQVLCVEIDEELAARAALNLSEFSNVNVVACDAHDVTGWLGAITRGTARLKLCVGFAVDAIVPRWLEILGAGGCLVAPVRQGRSQVLTRVERAADGLITSSHGAVRYVADRSIESKAQQVESKRALRRSNLAGGANKTAIDD
jgi:protein-L-isoaspartate(D-aspartate) O-methyltransferase